MFDFFGPEIGPAFRFGAPLIISLGVGMVGLVAGDICFPVTITSLPATDNGLFSSDSTWTDIFIKQL